MSSFSDRLSVNNCHPVGILVIDIILAIAGFQDVGFPPSLRNIFHMLFNKESLIEFFCAFAFHFGGLSLFILAIQFLLSALPF